MNTRNKIIFKFIAVILELNIIWFAPNAFAESCIATRTTVKPKEQAEPDTVAMTAASSPTPFVTQDIALEKTIIQDGDATHAQYFVRDVAAKDFFISASIDMASNDITLIVRDLKTDISSSSAGSFGKDGIVTANLATVVNGEQQLISLTCQK